MLSFSEGLTHTIKSEVLQYSPSHTVLEMVPGIEEGIFKINQPGHYSSINNQERTKVWSISRSFKDSSTNSFTNGCKTLHHFFPLSGIFSYVHNDFSVYISNIFLLPMYQAYSNILYYLIITNSETESLVSFKSQISFKWN